MSRARYTGLFRRLCDFAHLRCVGTAKCVEVLVVAKYVDALRNNVRLHSAKAATGVVVLTYLRDIISANDATGFVISDYNPSHFGSIAPLVMCLHPIADIDIRHNLLFCVHIVCLLVVTCLFTARL